MPSTMEQKEHQASLPFLLLHQARHLVSKCRSLAKAHLQKDKPATSQCFWILSFPLPCTSFHGL